MIVVVEAEGYCGLCYGMLRIMFKFHVFNVLKFFAAYRYCLTGNNLSGACLNYGVLCYRHRCCDLKCSNANSTL